MPDLRLHFLGTPQLKRQADPVDVSNAKAIALLAYLAQHQSPLSREQVVDLLWPDSAPKAARKNLSNTLWQIRNWAENDLVLDEGGLKLSPQLWVDTHQFEQLSRTSSSGPRRSPQPPSAERLETLEAGAALYRGPFLEGFYLNDAPDFELWLTRERERLAQLALRLLQELARGYRANGQWGDVIRVVQQALTIDPLQEPLVQLMMEAYAQTGQRSAALRQYDRLREALQQELGVPPLPETDAMRQSILTASPQAATRSADSAPVAKPPAPLEKPAEKPATAPALAFIGRERELATLDAALYRVRLGQAQVVLVSGEMGIGKTRLWHEWLARHRDTVETIHLQSLEVTKNLPFSPVITWLNQSSLLTANSPLPPAVQAELTRLMPSASMRAPELPVLPITSPTEERQRLFETLARCLLALLQTTLVCFVDDLHWADQSTRDWLGYLPTRLRQQPLLLVLAYRFEEIAPETGALFARWEREGIAQRLHLERLSERDCQRLIQALGVDAGRATDLYNQSKGNPYFLSELVHTTPGSVPLALGDLVRAKLAQLPPAALQVAQAASILGPDTDFKSLLHTSHRSEDEVLDALDVLLEGHVLAEQRDYYDFVHPLMAEIVRRDLSSARRSVLHRRAAAALEQLYADRLPLVAGRLIAHYQAAGDPSQAAHFADMAAESALVMTAWGEAVDFINQAMAIAPTPQRRLKLGQAKSWLGQLSEAHRIFEEALAEFEAQGDVAGCLQVCLELARINLTMGQGREGIAWAERGQSYFDSADATDATDATNEDAPCTMVDFFVGMGLRLQGQAAEAEAHFAKAAANAPLDEQEGSLPLIYFEWGNALAERGAIAEAVESFRQAITYGQKHQEPMFVVLGHNNLAYHLLLLDEVDEAATQIDLALEMAEKYNLQVMNQWLYSTRAKVAIARQQWAEAREWVQRGLTIAREKDNQERIASNLADLGRIAWHTGKVDEAIKQLKAAQQAVEPLHLPFLQSQIDLWLAEYYLENNQPDAAGPALDRATERLAANQHEALQAWANRLCTAIDQARQTTP